MVNSEELISTKELSTELDRLHIQELYKRIDTLQNRLCVLEQCWKAHFTRTECPHKNQLQ